MVFERREDRLEMLARELGSEADLVEVVPTVEHAYDPVPPESARDLRKEERCAYRSNLSTTNLSLSRHISLNHLLSSMDGRPGSTMTVGVKAVSSGLSECDE